HGLHVDNYREMWPYRDWVINAFNDNVPYDRFLTEQLAGDLLPGATTPQIVASGFNRAHVTTAEAGTIVEEIRARYEADRVETVSSVALGLTLGCARCHAPKFDPLSTKEYYQFAAFFNSLDDDPLDGNTARHPPVVRVPTPEQSAELEHYRRVAASIQALLAALEAARVDYDDPGPS